MTNPLSPNALPAAPANVASPPSAGPVPTALPVTSTLSDQLDVKDISESVERSLKLLQGTSNMYAGLLQWSVVSYAAVLAYVFTNKSSFIPILHVGDLLIDLACFFIVLFIPMLLFVWSFLNLNNSQLLLERYIIADNRSEKRKRREARVRLVVNISPVFVSAFFFIAIFLHSFFLK